MASSLFTVRSRRGSGGRRHSGAEQPHGAERPLTKEHELVATDAVEAPPEAPESRGVEDASQDPTSTAKVIDDGARTGAASAAHRPSRTRLALTSLLVVMITLGALAGWLEYRLRQTQQVAAQRAEFVQAARQGAVNLTTIDWQHAEADVQRILGLGHRHVRRRFLQAVGSLRRRRQTGSGEVGGGRLHRGARTHQRRSSPGPRRGQREDDQRRIPPASPRAWRMRIDLRRLGKDVKISNVEFVP